MLPKEVSALFFIKILIFGLTMYDVRSTIYDAIGLFVSQRVTSNIVHLTPYIL